MARTRAKSVKLAAIAAGLALGLTACGGSSSSGGNSTGGASGGTGSGEKPKNGGTLNVAGSGDVDFLDSAGAYYQVTYSLLRAVDRQLYTYPATTDEKAAITPAADLATDLPEVSADGKTYTIKIRQGAKWDTQPARQITAADAVRGIKRACNPVHPFGGFDAYYANVIEGMRAFCDGFTKVKPEAAALGDYVEKTQVSGLQAVDDSTLKIVINSARSDFMNILSLTSSAPVPVEVNKYVPDSPEFRANTISSGPYKIASYVASQKYELIRNPAWDAKTDPIRKAYVDKINIKMGLDEGPVFQQIKAGTVDMMWDTGVPVTDLALALQAKDKQLAFTADGSSNPYVVMNLQSPAQGGALKKLEVRQALNYAVNKAAIIQVLGGPLVKEPLDQILTPPLVGYKKTELYPTPDHKGDPAKAKELLTKAGYPNGLTLKFLYRSSGKSPQVATTLQADLKKAGINLQLVPSTANNFYTDYLQNPASTKAGKWDLAAPGWGPDWQGNAAFSFFGPLLDGRTCGQGSTNYGCYDSKKVQDLMDQALKAKTADEAAPIWAEADAVTMADAPWVPIVTGKAYTYRSSRVRNHINYTLSNNGDFTNIWLAS